MAGAIKDVHNEWRDRLQPASFRGVEFHVEVSARQSGRRTVVHEYPKRDDPYSEDMGRHAIRWAVTGYIVYGDRRLREGVIKQRDALCEALERDDAGTFQHPSMYSLLVMVERYSMTESKQKGGYFEFDMQFVEAGKPVLGGVEIATRELVQTRATAVDDSGQAIMEQILKSITTGVGQ